MIYNENDELDIPAYIIIVYFGLFGLYVILTDENVKRQL
jgi:hypothetical protein